MGESQKQIDQDIGTAGSHAASGQVMSGGFGGQVGVSKLSNSEKVSQLEPVTDSTTFKKELMKVTIDLGGGAQETILVREGETPNMVAKAFAEKFDLSLETEQLLQD